MVYNIHLLRFFSAMCVLVAHIIMWGNRKYGLEMFHLNKYAAFLTIGVDIFFIISGFVMMISSNERSLNFTNYKNSVVYFMKKRIVRIYPLWVFLCLLIVPIYIYNPMLISSDPDSNISIVKSLFLIPYVGEPILAVGWTLEYEMVFYIFFALTLFLSRLNQLVFISIIFIFFHFAIPIAFPDSNMAILKILSSPLLLYFLFGMMIGYFYDKVIYSKFSIFCVLLIAFISAIMLFQFEYDDINRALRFICASSIFLLFIGLEKREIWLSQSLYKISGDISYAIYLVHLIVIVAIGRLYLSFGIDTYIHVLWVLALMAAASIISAIILYYYFERRIMYIFRRKDV